MSEGFQFQEVRLHKPCDNLTAAISIIQSHILAADSPINPKVAFGLFHFTSASLEAAVAMLVALCEPLEHAAWDAVEGTGDKS